eukprot:403360998
MESTILKQVKLAIIGGSGATGREIIRNAKQDPRVKEIAIIARRTLDEWKQEDYKPELKIIQRENLENLHELQNQLQGYDIFINCIGARQKVGIVEYTKVEKEIPIQFAQLGKSCGINYFSYLSVMAANPKAFLQILRVKGEAEQCLFDVNLPCTTMFGPGTLVNRENDFRWAEWLFTKLPFPKIDDKVLAYAMYHHAIEKALELKNKEISESERWKISIQNSDIKKYAEAKQKELEEINA